MNSQKIKAIIITVLALLAAVYLGVAAATNKFEAVGWIVLGLTAVILVGLGSKVWLLIPMTAGLVGFVNAVPSAPPAWLVGAGLAGIMMLLRFLSRTNDLHFRWTLMDTLMICQLLVLAQAYVRNPTGLSIFGGGMQGGRFYFEYLAAIGGYFIMSFVRVDRDSLKKAILLFISVKFIDSIALAISGFWPGFAANLSRIYSNVDYAAATMGLGEGYVEFGTDTRFGSLSAFALLLGLFCVSFYPPGSCLSPHRPLRFLMFSVSVVATLFSGFRSALVRLGAFFVAACFAQRRKLDFVLAAIVGFLVLIGFIATDQVKTLPFAAQRVLSFLPVEVDAAARAEAQSSSDWRFEMWRLALTTDRFISNKMLGDGFGFSAAEARALANMAETGQHLTEEQSMDMFLTKGSYHGFHVETIRFTGALGLLVATTILIYFAIVANRQVNYYRGSQIQGYILFMCIPLLVDPLYYWLVFGSYKSDFVRYLLAAGILKMIDNVRVSELATLAREAVISPLATATRNGPRGMRRSNPRPLPTMKMG